jgi:hypothetical protein
MTAAATIPDPRHRARFLVSETDSKTKRRNKMTQDQKLVLLKDLVKTLSAKVTATDILPPAEDALGYFLKALDRYQLGNIETLCR